MFFTPTYKAIVKTISILFLVCLFFLPALSLQAQQATNTINLAISKISKNGRDENTQNVSSNSWKYDGELTLDDSIKYSWKNTDLNLKYKDNPKKGGGYLKIYKEDETKEENFVIDFGASPVAINKLADKLVEGENKIIFVFVDFGGKTATKVSFSFKFKNISSNPQVKVMEPGENAVLAKGIDQNIVLELSNFTLETTNSNKKDRGKLNVYFNDTKSILATFSFSKDLGNNKSEVRFNTKDLDASKSKIGDSESTKLIFALTKTSGELLPFQTSLKIRTNYNNSLNIGFPKINILEPRRDRSDLQVDGDRKFILNIENFEILAERKEGGNEDRKGYLQIIVDEIPKVTVFGKKEFSLNEIGFADTTEGRKTVKVQLVNKDFTRLNPEAQDTLEIVYSPKSNSSTGEPQLQNSTWRIAIVGLTIVLVIGGIAILVTKS